MSSKPEINVSEAEKKVYLKDNTEKKIAVCAYCRVSTSKDDQRNSFEAQKKFFDDEFKRHPNWTVRTVFADKGISGTSLKKRDEFNRMVAEAMAGKYNLIITKEVSRFSRNVRDILNIVGDLHDRGVYIWFLTEDIYTEVNDYEAELNKAGDQAEAESRKTSKRVKWGQRRQMENGVIFGRKEMFGYNIKRDENNEQYFEIIPEEAEVVQRVFTMYANGMGTFKIAKQLQQEGIKTKRYKKGWSNTVILRMLRNEKYVGDLETGKTYTPSFKTHEKKYNRGESAKIYIKNNHPEKAIIDRELWDRVQLLLKENSPSDEIKAKHSNRYWCSGKVFCGECGERYVSRTKNLKSGVKYKSWKCWNGQQDGSRKTKTLETGEQIEVGCNSESVNDKVLQQGMYDLLTEFVRPNLPTIIEAVKKTREQRQVEQTSTGAREIEVLKAESDKLHKKIIHFNLLREEGEITKMSYKITVSQLEKDLQDVTDKIATLSEQLNAEYDNDIIINAQIDELQRVLELYDEDINESVYRSLIDRIEVYNGHILKYYLYGLEPITMQYKATGRMDKYQVEFTIL